MQYDIRQYVPLTQEHEFTLLMHGRLAYGNGYGQTNGQDHMLPFYENYYAGGFSSLRGFRSNSVGPKAVYGKGGSPQPNSDDVENNEGDYGSSDSVGGNAMARASAELIVPTPFASEEARGQIRTSVFIDAASVWDTEYDVSALLLTVAGIILRIIQIHPISVPLTVWHCSGCHRWHLWCFPSQNL